MSAVRSAWFLVGLALTGCVTVPEFHTLRRDVDELKSARTQQGGTGNDARLAELGAQVDALHDEVARLRGQLEETEHLAQQALNEARSRKDAEPATPQVFGTPSGAGSVSEELRAYDQAFSIYRSGEYEAAIDRFKAFLQNNPSSDHADNALFWMGECYVKLGDFEKAVLTFEDVVNRFPDGNKVPDALYRQGIALLEIGKLTDEPATYQAAARQIFSKIVKEHPTSERVPEAQRQLERMQ